MQKKSKKESLDLFTDSRPGVNLCCLFESCEEKHTALGNTPTDAIFMIDRDITAMKKAEALLVEKEARIREMEAVGAISACIAHHFNNLMGSILGNAEMALEETPEKSLVRDCLEDIIATVWRGRDLVEHLTNCGHQPDTVRERVMMTPFVKEILEILKESMPAGVRLSTSFRTKCDVIQGDCSGIRQILITLFSNAVKAMEYKGGTLSLSLRNETLPESVAASNAWVEKFLCLTVKDTGTDVEEEIRDRVFKPCFTVGEDGLYAGFDLAVVYGIVKAHAGHILFSSAPGKGSEFKVYLPVIEEGTGE